MASTLGHFQVIFWTKTIKSNCGMDLPVGWEPALILVATVEISIPLGTSNPMSFNNDSTVWFVSTDGMPVKCNGGRFSPQ